MAEQSVEKAQRVVVRKARDGHRFPWAAYYPCCPFMNGSTGHGWPSWRGVMRQIEGHLSSHHGLIAPPTSTRDAGAS